MPKARSKRKTDFQTAQTKAVFLYGKPNACKRDLLARMQEEFTSLVNRDIALLAGQEERFFLQLVKNDKKDSAVRALEKSCRPDGVNSAFCQNAFDAAFTKLSNRLDAIRIDLFRRNQTVFTQSKVLFAMSVCGESKTAMAAAMRAIADNRKNGRGFYLETADKLDAMSDQAFADAMLSFADEYAMACLLFQIPHCRRGMVPLDSRLMVLEESVQTACTHVLAVTDPFRKNHRFEIPVDADRDALRRMKQYGTAGTVHVSVTKRGLLRVQVSFEKKVNRPDTGSICGVDTGMTDCFYCSDGRSIGTMKEAVRFYRDIVEPAFAYLSDLRNKKRKILHYVRTHQLPEDVRTSLLAKADRLEQMIRKADAPYRKKRHYYQILDSIVSRSVKGYISGISRDTLTVIERLDIKEFRKNRKLNGDLSVFARGLLQKKLMEQLNWHGFDFLEVEADYSSQTCPVCGNIDSSSRNGKDFTCTCCGHHDDADHNASVNLKMRAEDPEFLALCEKEKYHHKALQHGIKLLGAKRNALWAEKNTAAS